MKRAVLGISVLLAFVLAPRPAQAQRAEGGVAGLVRDPQGAAVAGAKVAITSERTDLARETTTDGTGFFRVANLPPGPYVVAVSAAGFKAAVAGGIVVQVGSVTRVDLDLEVGAIAEQVTVTGAARLIQTEEGRLSATIDAREVTELPLNGREVYQLVTLQPGVAATNAPVISNVPSTTSAATFDFGFVANGATPRSNNFVLDGNSNNNEWLGGTPLLFPSLDAIEEVQVQTLNFSAEYGRNNGAVVNVVTKSGSNELHGSGFYNFRDESLNARNYFDTLEKAPLSHHQFGVSLGGPIQRGKTFFFLNYEGSRREDGFPELAVAETPEFRNLVSQTRPGSLADQFLRDFPGPPCIEGTSRDTGSIASPAAGPFAVGPPDGIPDLCDISPSQVQDHRADQFLARVDHQFSDRDRVFVRWLATDTTPDVSRQQLLNANMRGFHAALDGFFSDLAVEYTRVSTSWTNILRFGWSRNHGAIDFEVPASQSRSILEAAGEPNFFAHLAFDDGVVPFGGAIFVPRDFQFDTLAFADTFSHTVGRHAFKYGFELRHIRERSDYELETRPFYEFNSVFNFANDQPWLVDALVNRDPEDSEFGDFADTPRHFGWTQWALFVQDDWKLTPRITLNLGLRYEVFGDPSEADGRLNNIQLGSGADIFEQMVGAVVGRTDRMFEVDYGNFAPRLGIAWDVRGDGRTAVRAGFSVAYLEPYSNLYTNASRFDPPDATFLTLFPALGVGTDINYQFPPAPSPDFASPVTANGGAQVANISPSGALVDISTARSLQWFVGFQHELGGGYAVAANYVGTRAEDNYIREDWNRYTGDICGASACDFTEDRLAPGWGQIFMVSNEPSASQYHGVNLQVRRQYREGFGFTVNYTLGKVEDNVTEGGLGDYFNVSTANYTGTMDVVDRDLDRGPSDFDVRHRLTISGLWDIPGPTEGTAGLLLGGWQLNGIVAYQSGRPFNVFCTLFWFQGCDFNMDGTRNDRPNQPANIETGGFSQDEFVDGVFAVEDFCPGGLVPFFAGTPCVPAGTNGDLPRNAFRGPDYASVDLALFKNFTFRGGAKLQLRWEVFNVFNRVNLFLPVGNLGSPNFGRSTAAFPARQMQLGLKLTF